MCTLDVRPSLKCLPSGIFSIQAHFPSKLLLCRFPLFFYQAEKEKPFSPCFLMAKLVADYTSPIEE